MTDPIADLLARIKNGILARKTLIDVPASKVKKRVAEILRDEGFLAGVTESAGDKPQGVLSLSLRWDAQNRPAIAGIRRVSKPGQRAYVGARNLPRVRRGLGTAIVSTSKGILTGRTARESRLGGEILCNVW